MLRLSGQGCKRFCKNIVPKSQQDRKAEVKAQKSENFSAWWAKLSQSWGSHKTHIVEAFEK